VLAAIKLQEAYFWATHAGAELDPESFFESV